LPARSLDASAYFSILPRRDYFRRFIFIIFEALRCRFHYACHDLMPLFSIRQRHFLSFQVFRPGRFISISHRYHYARA
jgi:hypothetical protein